MPLISAGQTSSFTLAAADALLVTCQTGDAVASVASGTTGFTGAPYELGRVVGQQGKQFGPYGRAVALTVQAIAGSVDATQAVNDGPGDPKLNAGQATGLTAPMSTPAAMLADSYGAIALTYTGGVLNYYDANNSLLAMSQLLGDAFDLVYDGSITGTNSGQWLANQLPGVLASSARVVFVGFPNNDPEQLNSYATTVANMTAIFAAIAAAGKQIVVHSAGSKSTWTAAQRAQAMQINAWITGQARANAWPLIDIMGGTYDPSTGVGSTALYLNESGNFVHPNAAGMLYAAAQSVQEFARFPGRVLQRGNSPYQGIYNTALDGASPGNGWTNYTSGVPTLTSQTKQNRVDGVGTFLRSTGTSDAANSRYGITQTINLTTAWGIGAKTLGTRIKGSFGDHWVCATAGTSSGSEPAAMAAASTVGQTVTDSGGVVWTRYSNIVPGSTVVQVRAEVDINTVSGGTGGAQPVILLNFGGAPVGYTGLRANNLGGGLAAQRWTFTKGRRTVIKTPPALVPLGTTSLALFVYQTWDAASITSTMDLYGLEMLVA